MNLTEALDAIAERYGMDAELLKQYAQEDGIGGYDGDEAKAGWPCGSLWGVEGQVLYALIRIIQPKLAVELGTLYGCSATHIASALHANGSGKLICVDHNGFDKIRIPEYLREHIEFIHAPAVAWAENDMPKGRVDFLYEDLEHAPDETEAVWRAGMAKVKKNAFILSHDTSHWIVGAGVRAGIEAAGAETLDILIEPSDCGLSLWRKGQS